MQHRFARVLRVVAATDRGAGDVAQPRQGEDRTYEGALCSRVERAVADLVEVARGRLEVGYLRDQGGDLGTHRSDLALRPGDLAGHLAQLAQLGVGLLEVASGDEQRGDAQDLQACHEVGRCGVVRDDNEVGPVPGDRFDVGGVARQLGTRHAGGVVRVVVDRHHLRAGTDREEHLGRGWREGHDTLGAPLQGTLPKGVLTLTGKRSAATTGRTPTAPAAPSSPQPPPPGRQPRPRTRPRPGARAWRVAARRPCTTCSAIAGAAKNRTAVSRSSER